MVLIVLAIILIIIVFLISTYNSLVKAKIKELSNEECEQEFSGNDAYALSILYDAFNLDKGEDVNESDDNGN